MIGGMEHRLLAYDDTYYHTMDETFWRARQESDYTWKVWDKEGMTYRFEDSARFLIIDSENNASYRTWRWSLTKIKNRDNQELTYTYAHETKELSFDPIRCDNQNGEPCIFTVDTAVNPDTIVYPNSRYRVKFETAARSDYRSDWAPKNDQRVFFSHSKLNAIRVEQDSNGDGNFETLIKKWAFTYAGSSEDHVFNGYTWSAGEKTLTLKKIEEYGLNGYGPLPATTFTYDANHLHLAEANNGQGGKVTFTYERISVDETHTAPASTWDDKIPQGSGCANGLSVSSNGRTTCYNTPFLRMDLDSIDSTPAEAYKSIPLGMTRPGGAYRISLNGFFEHTMQVGLRDGSSTTYSASSNAATVELVAYLDVNSSGQNLNALIRCQGCSIGRFTVGLVMTRYRVTTKVIDDGQLTPKTYAYTYGEAHSNDPAHSALIDGAATCKDDDYTNDLCYNEAYSEFRGHSWSVETTPDGRKTKTYYYQTDWLHGRAYKVEILNAGDVVYASSETPWVAQAYTDCHTPPTGKRPKHGDSDIEFVDLKICWVRQTEKIDKTYAGGSNWIGKMTTYSYEAALQGGAQYGNLTGTQDFTWDGSSYQALRATQVRFLPESR